jgi:hypothetical protein
MIQKNKVITFSDGIVNQFTATYLIRNGITDLSAHSTLLVNVGALRYSIP